MACLKKGYCNWKDATESFRKHESSKCHRDSVQVMGIIPATTADVGEILSATHAQEKHTRKQMLLKIIQNVAFLGLARLIS